MKAIKLAVFGLFLMAGTTFYGCQSEGFESKEVVLDLPETPYSYSLFGTTDHLPTLGRVLFYDPRLSVNNSVSCASCHKQQTAFADGAKLSLGFENKRTVRNSMPIQNIVSGSLFFVKRDSTGFTGGIIVDPGGIIIDLPFFQPTALFWDGRQHNLETMVMEPIQNHIEMGTTNLNQLAEKLSQIEDYRELFGKAYNDQFITPERIAKALSAFLVSIRANQSKFDNSMIGQAQLSGLEEQGKQLFFEKYDCNSCHQLQAPFNGYQLAGAGQFGGFADIGLDEKPTDAGVFKVSGNQADFGKFKIPSLRNVALTAPYMHDGRLETLEDVLDHYSENIEDSDNLDPRLRSADGSAKQFQIPASEKKAIIAFLNTMTDYQMITDPKFSNPFKTK